jgi:HprK-related kinase A
LAAAGESAVHEHLSGRGLCLSLGAVTLRVVSPSPSLATQIAQVYAHFPLEGRPAFADLHVRIEPPTSPRRWVRPQLVMRCDGQQHFHRFDADSGLPLMEWGTNWLIGERLHHLLLFHSACLERDGSALLMPAVPGSGKSTLCAALAHRGWRLLSDEFGACLPESGRMIAMLKPIALKNRSIDVIREYAPEAELGPLFPKTRKGTVAHMAAPPQAVRHRHETAAPGLVVLPRWREGGGTTIEPLTPDEMFRALAFNSFNYAALGATGFNAVIALVRASRGYRLEYTDLDDAVRTLERLWHERPTVEGPA